MNCTLPHMTNRSRKVLVLGSDTRTILAIACSLGRHNIEVHVGWCLATAPALRSRYVRCVHAIGEYNSQRANWSKALRALVVEEEFDLVIPATEAAACALQRHRDQFADQPAFHFLDQRAFEIAFDKQRTYALAEQLRIPVPATRIMTAASLAGEPLIDVVFPAVVKPSARDGDICKRDFARTVHDMAQLYDHVELLLRHAPEVLVQQYFTGVGVELIADRGEILSAFQHRRLHETTGYGSTYRTAEAISPALLEASQRLMKSLQYTGVAMVEFRVDPTTGAWVLLEINDRFWGSLPLAVAAGADFPYYLYQLLVEGQRTISQDYQCGVRCRDLTADLRFVWSSLRPKKAPDVSDEAALGWSVTRVSRWQLVCDTVRGLTLKDHVDSFAVDDPRPAFYELCQLAATALGWLGSKLWTSWHKMPLGQQHRHHTSDAPAS
jgi:predicted ATP-grasp superfamily ATP-dependent carboligase